MTGISHHHVLSYNPRFATLVPGRQKEVPMRKFIVDTDTASDDAAALMLAAAGTVFELYFLSTAVWMASMFFVPRAAEA